MPEEAKTDENKGPEEVWAVYCGDINLGNVAKLMKGLTGAGAQGTKRIHLLFQSWGGFVGDGVFLHNSLKKFPTEVVLYNAGNVSSAAAIAYLGGTARKTTANSIFMIHKGSIATNAGGERHKAVASSLAIDDARMEVILRTHLRLPEELWHQFLYHDVSFSGADAVRYGMADEIAEFSPPAGTKILNALP